MRRCLAILALALLLVVSVWPTRAQQPLRVLVLGDSLAHGAYATGPAASYPARFAVALGAVETMFVPPGGRLETAEEAWATYGGDGWDLVILAVAINDTLIQTLDDATWAARYAALVRAISASGAQVVCATPFDVGVMPVELERRAELVRANCQGGAIADLWLATRGRAELRAPIGAPTSYRGGGLAADDLHPTNEGQRVVFETILAAARPRLHLPLLRR